MHLCGILVRDINKKRDYKPESDLITDQTNEILENPNIDIIVEVMGGQKLAFDYVMKSTSARQACGYR